jgi:hypothetical protein
VLVEMKDPDTAPKLNAATGLTDYAVAYRYPDAQKNSLKLAEVKSAIDVARSVLADCIDKIK